MANPPSPPFFKGGMAGFWLPFEKGVLGEFWPPFEKGGLGGFQSKERGHGHHRH